MIKVERWKAEEKPDVFKLVKELEKEGLETYTFVSYPGDYYGEHSHVDDEVRIVLEGNMRFGAEGKIVELKPGDRLIVSKNTKHWAEVVGDKKCVLLSASR